MPHPSFHLKTEIMFKKYQGYSDLAFNVNVDGKLRRIVFDGQSRGTSIYSSRDAKEQKALESHHWFGDKFVVLEEVDEKKVEAEAKKKAVAKAKKTEEVQTHSVADIAEAKDYLADTIGISRSKMKTAEDILVLAKQYNVVIEEQE